VSPREYGLKGLRLSSYTGVSAIEMGRDFLPRPIVIGQGVMVLK